jgi:hypothetical protein
MRETLTATEVLVREGFKPMVYCVDDPIAAKQLEEAGAVAIMPAPRGLPLETVNPEVSECRRIPLSRRPVSRATTACPASWTSVTT